MPKFDTGYKYPSENYHHTGDVDAVSAEAAAEQALRQIDDYATIKMPPAQLVLIRLDEAGWVYELRPFDGSALRIFVYPTK